MIEAGVAAGLAVITGIAALTNRLHRRIDESVTRIEMVDRRIDRAELDMARNYVYKGDFENAFQKMEDHMIRIETKLDQLTLRNGQ
jgi:cell division septal protein FtsQ